MNYDVILLAGGKGKRCGLSHNKVLHPLKDGHSILYHAYKIFEEDEDCKRIILVISNEDLKEIDFKSDKLVIAQNGKERTNSVYNGLVKAHEKYVLIHDGARPYLLKEDLEKLKSALIEYGAAILGHAVKDTIKIVDNGIIKETPRREKLYMAFTPQAFIREELLACYKELDGVYRDDASIIETKRDVKLVEGSLTNIKITYPEDLDS